MISRRLYALVDLYVPLIAYFGVSPIAWSKASRCTIPSNHSLKKAYMNAFFIFVLVIFTIFQLIRFHIARDYKSFNVVLIFGVANFICMETFALMSFRENDARSLVNGILSYLEHINSTKLTIFYQSYVVLVILNFNSFFQKCTCPITIQIPANFRILLNLVFLPLDFFLLFWVL